MQPSAPKGQGSLFDMSCTKAEGFGAAQHGDSCWERGWSRASGSMHRLGADEMMEGWGK